MSANNISTLQYKADRQLAKLQAAAVKRAATGRRSTLDITELPTVYADGDNDTNHVVNNPNTGGLVVGRPWTEGTPLSLRINLNGTVAPAPLPIYASSDAWGSNPGLYSIQLNPAEWPEIANVQVGWTVTVNSTSCGAITSIDTTNPSAWQFSVQNDPGGTGTCEFVSPTSPIWQDQTTNNNDATITGKTYSLDAGGIVKLNGSSDYISLPTNFVDWLNNDITISIWFRTSDTGVILGQANSNIVNSGNAWVPAIYIGDDNKLHISTFWHNSVEGQTITTELNDNLWHMLTVTTQGVTQKVYIDGVYDSTYTFGQGQVSFSPNYYYYIGSSKHSGGWTNNTISDFMRLDLGSFKVWHGAMSSTQVTTEFNSTKTRFLGLYVDWFGDWLHPGVSGSGTSTALLNGTTLNSSAYFDLAVRLDSAFTLEGFTITIDANMNLGSSPGSYWNSMWGNERYSDGLGYLAYYSGDTTIEAGQWNAGNAAVSATAPDATVNARHLYVFVIDATSTAIYADGAQLAVGSTAPVTLPPVNFFIGARHGNSGSGYTDSFGGTYYRFKIESGTKTGGQIVTEYSNWLGNHAP